jgi:hypothetical protein
MHQAGLPPIFAYLNERRLAGHEKISDSSNIAPRKAVAGYSGRLVDDEKSIILIKNLNVEPAIGKRESFQPERSPPKRYSIAWKEDPTLLPSFSVTENFPDFYCLSDLPEREMGQARPQESIESKRR